MDNSYPNLAVAAWHMRHRLAQALPSPPAERHWLPEMWRIRILQGCEVEDQTCTGSRHAARQGNLGGKARRLDCPWLGTHRLHSRCAAHGPEKESNADLCSPFSRLFLHGELIHLQRFKTLQSSSCRMHASCLHRATVGSDRQVAECCGHHSGYLPPPYSVPRTHHVGA